MRCSDCDSLAVDGLTRCERHAADYDRDPPTLATLESRVAEAQRALAAERARVQAECVHPQDQLRLSYSGVSHYSRGDAQHCITVRCACGKQFAESITIIGDL